MISSRLLSVVAVAVAVALSSAVELNYDCGYDPCWPTLTTDVQGGEFDDAAPELDVTGIAEMTLNVTFVGAVDSLTFAVVEPNMEGGKCQASHILRDNDGNIVALREVEVSDFVTNTPATAPYTVTIDIPVAPYSVGGEFERYVLCADRIGNFLEVELPSLTIISPFEDYEDPWVVDDTISVTGPNSVDIAADCYAHGMSCGTWTITATVSDEPDNSTYESGVTRAVLAVRRDGTVVDRLYEMTIIGSTASVTVSFDNDDYLSRGTFRFRSIYTEDGAGNVGQDAIADGLVTVEIIPYEATDLPACTRLVISDTTTGTDSTAASIEVTITCTLGAGFPDQNYGYTQWRTTSDVALEEEYANSGDPLTYLYVNSDEVEFSSDTEWIGLVEFPIQGPNVQWELEFVLFTIRSGLQVLYDDCSSSCEISSASSLSPLPFVVGAAAAVAAYGCRLLIFRPQWR